MSRLMAPHFLECLRAPATYASAILVGWCNGNTPVFDTGVRGSNPCPTAIL